MDRLLLFLGGNGHCAARLRPARDALDRLIASGEVAPFVLHDVPYPGFEDRPRAPHLDAFLDVISSAAAAAVSPGRRVLLYGTGIGGLFALCLRARGESLDVPIVLQAPVLWGLESRLMPRLMRLGLARLLLQRLFASSPFQSWFVRRQLERRPSRELRRAFFDGYRRCAAAADLFGWLTPALLRRLEADLRRRPGALERVTVWWGGRDRVMTTDELRRTEKALGVRWPRRIFPEWGHYPMIADPEGWVRALDDALATAATVLRPVGPQAE